VPFISPLNLQWYHILIILPANSMTTQLQKLWIFCYMPAHYSSVLFRPLHSIHSDIRTKPSQLRRISTILHRQGRNEGGQAGAIPRAPNTARAPKSPKNVTNTFFNTVNLLLKEFRFEHGGSKLASCPGRHLTQNRRQKVFNRGALQFFGGALRLFGGLEIIKLTKTPHIYSV